MNVSQNDLLHAEQQFLHQQLAQLPAKSVLTRLSIEAKLKSIEGTLEKLNSQPVRAKAYLTFRGKPVVKNMGIFADFGSKATSAFTDAVAAIGASLTGDLAATGPIPHRGQHQFLITNTATGSFGFELEEHISDPTLFSEETSAAQSLKITQSLLQSSVSGSDEELADSVAGINSRSIEAVRNFVSLLATNDAVCALSVDHSTFSFHDLGEVRRSINRLSQENLHESIVTYSGQFLGVLPEGRAFEFRDAKTNELLRGKISVQIDNPASINQHLKQPVEITILRRCVGVGKPRYELIDLPQWDH
ncbi:hypothetical protein [Planctopirus hydrillae]|uniref:Uncharacterized protein n=1 Tax=Planctopirus hydrillae TaxID=1841610 RepID=A0A1C3E6A6_9PLAN|nr:hypothetical protein [Planctopirus hydrillae]ODA28772.1 hypothetical protein A6X21_11020 [Planctopirus hydrillae]